MRLSYWFCRLMCQWTCVLLVKARVFGRHNFPASGGVLLVSNHQSFMDPVLVTMALDREGNYMARDTLFKNKWFGRLITFVNAYPIRRGTADMVAIKETMRRLKDGRVVAAFPEGTRSPDGRVGPMLAGLATVAKKCKAPIVPTLIDGMDRAWPRHRMLPGTGDVVIEYGKPITADEYASMTPDELTEEIRRRIIQMQANWHRRVPARRLQWFKTEAQSVHGSQAGT
jgi:1-acyl-sn-glycerol-3-phosphate acyltransferase